MTTEMLSTRLAAQLARKRAAAAEARSLHAAMSARLRLRAERGPSPPELVKRPSLAAHHPARPQDLDIRRLEAERRNSRQQRTCKSSPGTTRWPACRPRGNPALRGHAHPPGGTRDPWLRSATTLCTMRHPPEMRRVWSILDSELSQSQLSSTRPSAPPPSSGRHLLGSSSTTSGRLLLGSGLRLRRHTRRTPTWPSHRRAVVPVLPSTTTLSAASSSWAWWCGTAPSRCAAGSRPRSLHRLDSGARLQECATTLTGLTSCRNVQHGVSAVSDGDMTATSGVARGRPGPCRPDAHNPARQGRLAQTSEKCVCVCVCECVCSVGPQQRKGTAYCVLAQLYVLRGRLYVVLYAV